MKPDDRVRLRHIADALSAAIRFTTGRSREDLDRDEMLAFALLHAIQIVGEAAGKECRIPRPTPADSVGAHHRYASSVSSRLFRYQSRHLVDDGRGIGS
jgi:hypothetical protein